MSTGAEGVRLRTMQPSRLIIPATGPESDGNTEAANQGLQLLPEERK
jgi:hypothetical protein